VVTIQREEIKKARELFQKVSRRLEGTVDQAVVYNLMVKAYLKGRIQATKAALNEIK
jgi:hypothetical protein